MGVYCNYIIWKVSLFVPMLCKEVHICTIQYGMFNLYLISFSCSIGHIQPRPLAFQSRLLHKFKTIEVLQWQARGIKHPKQNYNGCYLNDVDCMIRTEITSQIHLSQSYKYMVFDTLHTSITTKIDRHTFRAMLVYVSGIWVGNMSTNLLLHAATQLNVMVI